MYDPQGSPPTTPLDAPQIPPPERRGSALRWILIGLSTLMVLQICVLVVLLVASPKIRGRVLGLVGQSSVAAPPEAPKNVKVAKVNHPVKIEENFDQPTTR